MITTFTSLDFETSYGHIPCSIGIVEFVDGKVISEYSSLIKPINLQFSPINSRINGISLDDVENEREFDEIWNEIQHYFPEIFKTGRNCKFHNCMHINEPKCAVLENIENGEILESRYQNYLKLVDEAEELEGK